MATVEQAGRGSLSPSKTHTKIMKELGKVRELLASRKELGTTSIDKLPGTKQEKIVFKSQVGSELNVDQRGKAELSARAALIKLQTKQAGSALTKEQKALFEAQAEASEAVGQFLENFVKGTYSVEQAFAKKNGWFWGYTAVDRFIRATFTIAEKGGNHNIALENIKALEGFKEVPVVSAALAKNATKIAQLKSKAEDPRTAAFQEETESSSKGYGEGARAGEGLPPELLQKAAQQPKKN